MNGIFLIHQVYKHKTSIIVALCYNWKLCVCYKKLHNNDLKFVYTLHTFVTNDIFMIHLVDNLNMHFYSFISQFEV